MNLCTKYEIVAAINICNESEILLNICNECEMMMYVCRDSEIFTSFAKYLEMSKTLKK